MTIHDDTDRTIHQRDTRDANVDRVDAVRGTPTDRVRWGPILAGAFAALTTLAILSTLGAAIGFSSYDRGQDDARNFAMAGGVWGILSTIVAFALGGWVAARSSAVRGGDNGILNGALVAAVAIPLILFMVGSAATAMSAAEVANNRDPQARGQQDDNGSAMTASARIGDAGDASAAAGANDAATTPDAERARQAGSRTAWGMLTTMVLAVAAAATAGFVGARRDDDNDGGRRRKA